MCKRISDQKPELFAWDWLDLFGYTDMSQGRMLLCYLPEEFLVSLTETKIERDKIITKCVLYGRLVETVSIRNIQSPNHHLCTTCTDSECVVHS